MTQTSVSQLVEAAPLLRRPFTPAAVKWRALSVLGKDEPKGVQVAGYIDARLVIERLNMVVPDRWHDEYRPFDGAHMWCDLTVCGVRRSDVGEGTSPKALVSDALKRAAVRFGIGVSLYAIPSVQVWASQQPDHVRFWKVRDKHQGELTPAGSAALTARYAAWLERVGVAQFGEPLDHGDIEAHPRPTSNAYAVVAEATEALDAVEVTA